MSTLSSVTVRARAVIPLDGGIVVARETRSGRPYTTVPGGRVTEGESVPDALVREVLEETGLKIVVGPLLYVVEVRAPVGRQDLNLIFLASTSGRRPQSGAEVIDLQCDDPVLPPILDHVRSAQESGWVAGGSWLGNLWDSELGR